ncbi:MAG: tRNA (N(6)-L-threonylcarbamoyladenosine(37)-C(2))-methylthiotransferase MtaB, partial [Treponema sp.]|nr:tRNA (N(6)-L-threonylcarbamoyladenosine(37)-C(2))-methylthiotransferase MtaB [Treponema sp.]
MSFSVVFETLGCRLNQIESEAAMSFFSEQGFLVFPNSSREIKKENVILALLNTCAVTQKSEQKARYKIRYLLNLYPNACILVTGCYAELSHTSIK